MSDITTLQFDPESVKNRIIANLTTGLEADTTLDSVELLAFGTNMRIINAIAEEISEAARYDEYLTRETKWAIARNQSSIMTMASFFNYKPHRKVGSTGQVVVSTSPTFNGNWSNSIAIPKMSAFSNGVLTYAAKTDFILLSTDQKAYIDVIQGIPTALQYTISQSQIDNSSNGYIKILIDDPDFENVLYTVTVNGMLCSELSSLRLAVTGADQVFTLKNKADFSGVILEFGNGVFGRALALNDVVVVVYLKTAGPQGDISSTNVVTKTASTFFDSSLTQVTLYVTNESVIINGKAVEDLESIRANAPSSYQTGQRAISRSDYVFLIKASGFADYATVWGEQEYNIDIGAFPGSYVPNQENMIYVAGYVIDPTTKRGVTIPSAGQSAIRGQLNLFKGPTDIISFVDTQFVYIDFIVSAFVSDSRYSVSQVSSNIQVGLENEYALTNFSFFLNLYYSQYYQYINTIAGVNHHITYLAFTQYMPFNSAYQFSMAINMDHVMVNSVKLWYQHNNDGVWWQFGNDDGSGNIVGFGPFVIPSAHISYASGLLSGPGTNNSVNVSTGFPIAGDSNLSNYQLKITYQMDTSVTNGDVIMKKRYQLMSFGSATIAMTSML